MCLGFLRNRKGEKRIYVAAKMAARVEESRERESELWK